MTQKTDIRLRGFADRASLEAAWAWLDAQPAPQAAEAVTVAQANGRVLATDIVAPPFDASAACAAEDGYAVRAADCDGASAYNPLLLAQCPSGCTSLPPAAATAIAAGWSLPEGADAVLPFEAAEAAGEWLSVLAPVAVGAGTRQPGYGLTPCAVLVPRGRLLLPQDVCCLAGLGLATVPVLARPMVRLLVRGAKSGPDALTPMLLPLLDRDGAVVEQVGCLGAPPHRLTIVVGRSGAGPDDDAAPAIRACGGEMACHGLALHPGGSSGLGVLGGEPVVLLPGEPAACRAAYDMLAARLVRRLAGLPRSPYATARLPLARKIVSGIGLDELVPVRVADGLAHPIDAGSGPAALLADGFVLVAAPSEGYPAAALVTVHLYRSAPCEVDMSRP